MLKAILFDNDGVLVHSEALWFEANSKILTELGVPYTREDFIEHTFMTGLGSSGWLKKNGCTEALISEFTERRNQYWHQEVKTKNLIDDAAMSVVSELKEMCKIVLVTNSGAEECAALYQDSPLWDLFDIRILRDDYERRKPAPDGYVAALSALAISPLEAMVVEDSPRGILAGQAAGISVIALKNPLFPELDTSTADHLVGSLAELPALVKKLEKELI